MLAATLSAAPLPWRTRARSNAEKPYMHANAPIGASSGRVRPPRKHSPHTAAAPSRGSPAQRASQKHSCARPGTCSRSPQLRERLPKQPPPHTHLVPHPTHAAHGQLEQWSGNVSISKWTHKHREQSGAVVRWLGWWVGRMSSASSAAAATEMALAPTGVLVSSSGATCMRSVSGGNLLGVIYVRVHNAVSAFSSSGTGFPRGRGDSRTG